MMDAIGASISGVDLIFAGILLLSAVLGARRGLFLCLSRLLRGILALLGAALLAARLQEPLAQWLTPWLEDWMTRRVEGMEQDALRQWLDGEVLTGFLPELLSKMTHSLGGELQQSGLLLAQRMLLLLCYVLIFTLSFFLLLWFLRLFGAVFDRVFDLPILHGLNRAGGFFFGLLEGAFWIWLVLWIWGCLSPDSVRLICDESRGLSFIQDFLCTGTLSPAGQ